MTTAYRSLIVIMRVFVLLFNAGTENEGIHTIQMGAINKVLMFESEDDATRYALLLEAQDFPTPTVEKIDSPRKQCLRVGLAKRGSPPRRRRVFRDSRCGVGQHPSSSRRTFVINLW